MKQQIALKSFSDLSLALIVGQTPVRAMHSQQSTTERRLALAQDGDQPVEARSPVDSAKADRTATTGHFPNHKVLVADDDEAVRESLHKLLYAEGYQVVSVANGVEALETFRQEVDQIDLLLLDLNMPLKNGWAVLERLIEANPSLPILIVTGQPNQYELAEAAGVSALVEKPIDVPALLQLIKELLPGPVESRRQHADRQEFPFHHLRAAGYASRYSWTEQNVTPYRCGGLNE